MSSYSRWQPKRLSNWWPSMPEIDYESSALVFAAAALAASEGQYEEAKAVLENYDGELLPVAFGLAVLAGQAVIPANGMAGVLSAVERLLRQPADRH
jgi:hypothetical protein